LSDTNKSGSPKPNAEQSDKIVIRRPRLVLLLGGVVLLLLFYIGTQVFGVLYGIVFPAQPPLPPDVHEITHENADYGFDTWLYGTDQDACEVVAFYATEGGRCLLSPGYCNTGTVIEVDTPGQHVARCSGEQEFSIFAMRWNAIIATGDEFAGKTQFRLEREVFWSGSIPKPTPTPSS
jgi:hypothetical protein